MTPPDSRADSCSSSEDSRSSIASKLAGCPLVSPRRAASACALSMLDAPSLSRNASVNVRVVTPPTSLKALVSVAQASYQPSKSQVLTTRLGGSISK